MNNRQRIELTDNTMDILLKLSEGNPGALTAMMTMMRESPSIDADSAFGPLTPLIALDMSGIYGSHIWVLWKDVCGQSVLNVQTLFRSVQMGLMNDSLLVNAANTGRHNFNFPALLLALQKELPNFGRCAIATPSATVACPTPSYMEIEAMTTHTIPLRVLTEAVVAMQAAKDVNGTLPEKTWIALVRACNALDYHVEKVTRAIPVEVAS